MVFFNYALRKLNAKIVYYGPGLCGKTTNLQWIHDHFEGGQRGKMISLATEGDRTIFFDLLPLEIGTIRGMQVTLQLYTVPGQVHYNSTRQLVLRGADGVVFVADSQRTMHTSNLDSFKNLQENLLLQGINLEGFPLVLQFNKRDLRDLISTEELNEQLNPYSVPIFDAIATEGVGVQETLEGIVKLVMRSLRERYEPVVAAGGPEREEVAAEERAPITPPPPPVVPSLPIDAAPPDLAPPDVSPPAAADVVLPPDPAMTTPLDEAFASAQDVSTEDFGDVSPAPPPFDEAKPVATLEDDVSTGVYGEAEEELEDALESVARFMDEPPEVLQEPGFTDAPPEPDFLSEPDSPPEADFLSEPESPPEADFLSEPEAPSEPDFDLEKLADDAPEPSQVVDFPDESFDHARTDSGFEVPGMSEIAIGGDQEPEPALEQPPAPEEDRYEDRIQAPSPFAPQEFPAAVAARAEEIVLEEPEAAFGGAESAFGVPEAADIEPAVLDQFEDTPIEVPVFDEPDPQPEEQSVSEDDQESSVQRPGSYVVAGDAGSEPVEAGDESLESQEVAEDVRQAFGAGENIEALASLVAEANADLTSNEAVEIDLPEVEATEPDETEGVSEEFFGDVPEQVPEEPTDEFPEEVPEVVPPEPEVEEPEPEIPETIDVVVDDVVAEAVPDLREDVFRRPPTEPIVVGEGDPFADEDEPPQVAAAAASIQPAVRREIDVHAEDNQLHLRLQGTGAIVESGQVRALDIEVPVPGSWVGNRRVTLQLRLTLTPSAEDENGGAVDPS